MTKPSASAARVVIGGIIIRFGISTEPMLPGVNGTSVCVGFGKELHVTVLAAIYDDDGALQELDAVTC